MSDGSLMVYEYTGQGFLPSIIDPVPLDDLSAITFLGSEVAKKHPVVRDWSVVETLGETGYEEKITYQANTVQTESWDLDLLIQSSRVILILWPWAGR
jgi:hypothetical protein